MERTVAVIRQESLGQTQMLHPVSLEPVIRGRFLEVEDEGLTPVRLHELLLEKVGAEVVTAPGTFRYARVRPDGDYDIVEVDTRLGWWAQDRPEVEHGDRLAHYNVHVKLNVASTACGKLWGGRTNLRSDVPRCAECERILVEYLQAERWSRAV